jgi:hydroxyethylthiazole kinase
LVAVETGDVLMTLSTALGCALSATTAAFAAITTPLQAATAALAVYGAAGKEAASRVRGPGHLPAELCDVLHVIDGALLARNAVITTRVL